MSMAAKTLIFNSVTTKTSFTTAVPWLFRMRPTSSAEQQNRGKFCNWKAAKLCTKVTFLSTWLRAHARPPKILSFWDFQTRLARKKTFTEVRGRSMNIPKPRPFTITTTGKLQLQTVSFRLILGLTKVFQTKFWQQAVLRLVNRKFSRLRMLNLQRLRPFLNECQENQLFIMLVTFMFSAELTEMFCTPKFIPHLKGQQCCKVWNQFTIQWYFLDTTRIFECRSRWPPVSYCRQLYFSDWRQYRNHRKVQLTWRWNNRYQV